VQCEWPEKLTARAEATHLRAAALLDGAIHKAVVLDRLCRAHGDGSDALKARVARIQNLKSEIEKNALKSNFAPSS
jgi:hypothetical protein